MANVDKVTIRNTDAFMERKCIVCGKVKKISSFLRDGSKFYSTVCNECYWIESILSEAFEFYKNPPKIYNATRLSIPKVVFLFPKSPKKEKPKVYKPRTIKPERTQVRRARHLVSCSSISVRKVREIDAGGSKLNWFEWSKILKKYGAKCLCCGATGVSLTQDHVLPISLGGKTIPENMQPLCKSCNSRKNNRFIDFRPFL